MSQKWSLWEAFGPGLLGLENFLPTGLVFRTKPLKVGQTFSRASQISQPRIFGVTEVGTGPNSRWFAARAETKLCF